MRLTCARLADVESQMSAPPLSRVKRLMQEVPGTGQVSSDATRVAGEAARLFLEDLLAQATANASEDGRVCLADLRGAVAQHSKFDFLRGVNVEEPKPTYRAARPRKKTKVEDHDAAAAAEQQQQPQQDQDKFDTGAFQLPELPEGSGSGGKSKQAEQADTSSEDEDGFD